MSVPEVQLFVDILSRLRCSRARREAIAMSKAPETPAKTPDPVTTLAEERTARRQAGKAGVSSVATIPDGGAPTTAPDKRAALGKAPNDKVSRARHGAWKSRMPRPAMPRYSAATWARAVSSTMRSANFRWRAGIGPNMTMPLSGPWCERGRSTPIGKSNGGSADNRPVA